jgi:WD40 repeat protein
VETAWHGDRLLSGAADRTIKLWDLASQSGGRCLQTMHGHTSWVTHGRYWGRNTIISASSDRSIALWDARSGSSPLNILRYHNGPISDLYLESRNSFWMASAGSDGTIATWDFRMMKTLNEVSAENMFRRTNPVRTPRARMVHVGQVSGPVLLRKGLSGRTPNDCQSIMSATIDDRIKEWNPLSGDLITEHKIRCGNKMSCFKTFSADECLTTNTHYAGDRLGGTITASWDGSVRIRQLFVDKQ